MVLAVALAGTACRLEERGAWLVIWTDTRGGGSLHVSVNGAPSGVLTDYFLAGEPACAQESEAGVVRVRLAPGTHVVRAADAVGRSWEGRVQVGARCTLVRLAPPGAADAAGVIAADTVAAVGRATALGPS